MMRQVVQLTDCHLFANREQQLREIATWTRFATVVRNVGQRFADCDLLVLTGDTAHDELTATYEMVQEELRNWGPRLRAIPGNHDDRGGLRGTIVAEREIVPGRITFQSSWEHWQIIGLDSHCPGETSGRLGSEQLDWLHAQLQATSQLHTLVLLHHPPIRVQSPWIDKLGLEDADQLAQVLDRHPQVRLVGCGHVHQEVVSTLKQAVVATTPAVGPPFRPRTNNLEIDSTPPSYRVWELYDDGHWSTQVLTCST